MNDKFDARNCVGGCNPMKGRRVNGIFQSSGTIGELEAGRINLLGERSQTCDKGMHGKIKTLRIWHLLIFTVGSAILT